MKNNKIQRLVGIAIMSAIVVILQLLGSFIKLGPMVSVSLVQIPIVVGAAMYGPAAGAVLGGVFGIVVLTQPDTAFFYGISFFGTVITVLVKGTMEGLLSGMTYRALSGKNQWLAAGLAAAVAPLVNTGLFSLGCRLFFWDAFAEMGNGDAMMILLTVMIGFNFIAEFAVNVICSPVIVRILKAAKKC
ncbi:MAG: ECF transporter S component [Oscillospiraceae bacterium]|nr:ECF transporter S component [Oscillospiraceae bacterium]